MDRRQLRQGPLALELKGLGGGLPGRVYMAGLVRKFEVEGDGLEHLPQPRRGDAGELGQHVVEHGRARARRGDDDDRREDLLLADLRVATQQLLDAQTGDQVALKIAAQTQAPDQVEIGAHVPQILEHRGQGLSKAIGAEVVELRLGAGAIEEQVELELGRDAQAMESATDDIDGAQGPA